VDHQLISLHRLNLLQADMFNLVMCATGNKGGEIPKQRQTDITALGASSEASSWENTHYRCV
jgi:hypothetical protein